MPQTRLNLQEEEKAVLEAASRVFAGFAASGAVDRDNVKSFTRFSLRVALTLARKIDEEVTSSGELEMPPLRG